MWNLKFASWLTFVSGNQMGGILKVEIPPASALRADILRIALPGPSPSPQ